jgi:hypothetical protein
MRRRCILSESQFVRHRRKDTGDAFLLLASCAPHCEHHDHLAEWSGPLDADGQQAAGVLMPTCRPGSSVLDGLQPGRQATRRKSGQGHIHIAACGVKPLRGARHQRFGTGTTNDHPGPRAGTSPCHCPIADPPTAQYLYHSDRTPRYSKRWDVERARSEAEARSQTCGRELDSY